MWKLPGQLGIPFPEWTKFHENSFDVAYVEAPFRNWTTGNMWVRSKLYKDLLELAKFIRDFSLYTRLFIAGFSDGATLCNYLVVENPEIFSGALIHSGLWVGGTDKNTPIEVPTKKIPISLISGGTGFVEKTIAKNTQVAYSFYKNNHFPVMYERDESQSHTWNVDLVNNGLKFLGF